MPKLSPTRQKALDFILAHQAERRRLPTKAEIAEHMGWKHAGSALNVLLVLSGDGYIRRTWENGRWLFWVEERELA